MLLPDWAVLNAAIEWLAHGMWNIAWWQIVLFTLALTHVTMISVTVFLHRHQAHRALDLHPIASHFFRFWLWLTTGQVTKEWAAIHRKHHAKCEQAEDPHSPHVYGIKKVLFEGAELYRAESKNKETMARFGHGTPDDWIERNLYTRFSWQGVALMLIIDLALFGAAGLTAWAVQMLWIRVTAAGIINQIARGLASLDTKSASDDDPVAFSWTSSCTALGDMSKTVHWCPPLSNRRTMFAPMRPSPIIPSCMVSSLCAFDTN